MKKIKNRKEINDMVIENVKLIAKFLSDKNIAPLDIDTNMLFYYGDKYKGYSFMDLSEYLKYELSISLYEHQAILVKYKKFSIINVETNETIFKTHRRDLIEKKLKELIQESLDLGINIKRNDLSSFRNDMVYPYTTKVVTKSYFFTNKNDITNISAKANKDFIHIYGMAKMETTEEWTTIDTSIKGFHKEQITYDTKNEDIELIFPNVFDYKPDKGFFKRKYPFEDYLILNYLMIVCGDYSDVYKTYR